MILAFVAAALALEPAFECEPLTEPADGLKYANPGELSGAVYDRLLAWAEAQYEDDCPLRCEGGGDEDCAYEYDCVTTAGTRIAVAYEYDTWDYGLNYDESRSLSVETASGASLTLTSYQHTYWVYGGGVVSGSDLTWDATWAGSPDPALPGEATVGVSLIAVDNADWPYATVGAVEEWQDGTCAWSAGYTNSGYYGSYSDGWMIQVGEQALRVDRDAWCGGTRTATLDEADYSIASDTWEVTVDADADGAEAGIDCDDADPTRSPCFEDVVCDGIDQDCDGADDTDGDDDGYTAECGGGDDCDDADYGTHPGAWDHPYDGIDQDCDGADEQDVDDDGAIARHLGGTDCEDRDFTIHPGAPELACDGIDQDCDGEDPCPDGYDPWAPADMPTPTGCGTGTAALLLLVTFGHARRRAARPSPRVAPP